ncbi:hypothetical protein [Francisella sp. TX07-6608]|uniref:hypothetical protein n=1 Tax=Francisella sp. TX07-6608 TaxID=573568 RepID=UPI0008F9E387|nr:hypothetical protein [Francisella sp. TX07-6608]OIN84956.1 hypothetical protein KX00_2274 [Francisella sp. TX07-6608]OIN85040.1 hypothetical protein KX00_2236 [Francisella sp. TX07-6608]
MFFLTEEDLKKGGVEEGFFVISQLVFFRSLTKYNVNGTDMFVYKLDWDYNIGIIKQLCKEETACPKQNNDIYAIRDNYTAFLLPVPKKDNKTDISDILEIFQSHDIFVYSHGTHNYANTNYRGDFIEPDFCLMKKPFSEMEFITYAPDGLILLSYTLPSSAAVFTYPFASLQKNNYKLYIEKTKNSEYELQQYEKITGSRRKGYMNNLIFDPVFSNDNFISDEFLAAMLIVLNNVNNEIDKKILSLTLDRTYLSLITRSVEKIFGTNKRIHLYSCRASDEAKLSDVNYHFDIVNKSFAIPSKNENIKMPLHTDDSSSVRYSISESIIQSMLDIEDNITISKEKKIDAYDKYQSYKSVMFINQSYACMLNILFIILTEYKRNREKENDKYLFGISKDHKLRAVEYLQKLLYGVPKVTALNQVKMSHADIKKALRNGRLGSHIRFVAKKIYGKNASVSSILEDIELNNSGSVAN